MKFKVTAVPTIIELKGKLINTAVYEIGAWNMDTLQVLQPAHTLDILKVLNFHAIIHNDAQDEILYLTYPNNSGVVQGQIILYDNYFNLWRQTAGVFDSADYSSVLINRGFVIVRYYI